MVSIRKKLFLQLESEQHSHPTPLDWFLITLIVLNVFAVIVESEHPLYLKYRSFFDWFEIFSVVIFSIEYIARLWCIPEKSPQKSANIVRWGWACSSASIIDLLAILPSLLYFFVPFDLRMLRLLRLLRLLKLARYFAALRILLDVLKREKSAFQAVLLILIIVIIIAATSMFVVEHKAQPKVFGSIFQSMWWAVVTLTTVGYGDVVPITALGKTIGAIITIMGIGMAALPAGILASGLADELRRRRQTMESAFRKMLLDGKIDVNEGKQLRNIRKELGISQELANEILQEVLAERRLEEKSKSQHEQNEAHPSRPFTFCPHCGERLPSDAVQRTHESK